MSQLGPLLAFWRALDELFARVRPTGWGAVVTDPRFPEIDEANYARVETSTPIALAEIERELLPDLRGSGARRAHVVVFSPEAQTALLAEASTRGDRLVFDLAMAHPHAGGDPAGGDPAGGDRVEEIGRFDRSFWRAYAASLRHFDVRDPAVIERLAELERDVLVPAGRRWFAVRERDEPVALASLLVLAGSGYIDHVVTFPEHRGRGFAAALTGRAVHEAAAAGAARTLLLAEPGSRAARIYARLGFEPLGHLASWRSPLP